MTSELVGTTDPAADSRPYPAELSDAEATVLAYGEDIDRAASLLRCGLSVLISCDKAISPHLWQRMVHRAGRTAVAVVAPADEPAGLPAFPSLNAPSDGAHPATERSYPQPAGRSFRQRYLDQIRARMAELSHNQVLVMLHLDLLASSVDNTLAPETRELVELLYGPGGTDPAFLLEPNYERVLLGFVEPSMPIPPVLANRFVVRLTLTGISSTVIHPADRRTQRSAEALVLAREVELFQGYDPDDMYKHLAGLHPVRLRQAMRYAYDLHNSADGSSVQKLRKTIQDFKAETSSTFELPDVKFENIGGYGDVKAEMREAIEILMDAHAPEQVRRSLPRGYIFWGPPGTGKTMFAKAIASEMSATINVVSGPEVTSTYFGESERRVRDLFAEARRNAPSIIVFDEIDAIAGQRSSFGDGGTRANNAIVAQILTEMDGFRPDLPMLVIGTTNQIRLIDVALLRPSRFQPVEIGLPDELARRGIIEVCASTHGVGVPPELMSPLVKAMTDWNGDEIRAVFARVAALAYRNTDDDRPIEVLLGEIVGQRLRARIQAQAIRISA